MNLVLNPLLLEGLVVLLLAVVTDVDGGGLGGIKFRSSGRDGQLLVWWPSFSHSAQGGGMRGGSGVVGSFFFLLPPDVAGGLVICGVVGVRMEIVMGIPSCGGRDGRGTISGGCKYHTRLLTPY